MAESRGQLIIKSDDTSLLIRAVLFDAADAKITSSTVSLRIWHIIPTSGALETYDFNDNTFKTGAVTTPTDTALIVHRQAENSTYDTGVWSGRFTDLASLVLGDKYLFELSHTNLPRPITVEYQYGGHEGDTVEDTMEFDVTNATLTQDTVAAILNRLNLTSRSTGFTNLADILGVPDTVGATVVGEVWEELIASHNAAGTMGEVMNNISGGFDTIWDALAASHTTAGSFGAIVGALNLTTRTNNGTLDSLIGVPDTAGVNLVDAIFIEDITAHVSNLDSFGASIHALGHAIANRTNRPTLNGLLNVSDVANATIAWTILDEVVDGSNHTTADSLGQRITAMDDLTQASGDGDLAAIKTQADKLDSTDLAGSPSANSVGGKLDSIITTLANDRDALFAVNIQSDGLRVEVAVVSNGTVELTPWTRCSAQIFDENDGIIAGGNISIGNFGSIGTRGFFTFTQATHGVVAGQIYQITFTIDDGPAQTNLFTATRSFVTIQG